MFVERYQRDGYFFPIDVMSEARAAELRGELELCQAELRSRPNAAAGAHPHLVMPWVDALIREEAILGPVRELLGEDLLVWGTSFFVKEARSESYVSWHQDLHYWDLDDLEETTAWLALSPVTAANGCMRFVPGSHRGPDVDHRDTFAEENMLTRGQELAHEVDESEAVDVVLHPGQMSLHHGRTFHASHANRSGERRIGVAIRYISPSMRQTDGTRTLATLVSGTDRFGHFELTPPPSGVLMNEDVARAERAEDLRVPILYRTATKAGHRRA